MREILAAASDLQKIFEDAQRPMCFIGGLAVQRWGEMRFTKDADAAVKTELGEEDQVIELLQRHFDLRRPDTLEFAKVSRVILLQDRLSSIGLDLSLAASGYEVSAIERSTPHDYGLSYQLRTCSAEDLIVYKAIADRVIDWHDIRGVLIRQRGKLDFALIEEQLAPLVALKEAPHILDRWGTLRKRYE